MSRHLDTDPGELTRIDRFEARMLVDPFNLRNVRENQRDDKRELSVRATRQQVLRDQGLHFPIGSCALILEKRERERGRPLEQSFRPALQTVAAGNKEQSTYFPSQPADRQSFLKCRFSHPSIHLFGFRL